MAEKASDVELSSGLLPRDPEKTRAWHIEVNGERLTGVRTLTIHCERKPGDPNSIIGVLDYGAEPGPDGSPSAYDTWIFYELGGAVTLPFTVKDGQLLVGVVEQRRNCERHEVYNPSGVIQNAPRGLHNPRMNAAETAAHELKGEVGAFMGSTHRLPGSNSNSNNAWLKYHDERNDAGASVNQGGLVAFAVEVNPDIIERSEDGWHFKPGALGERPKGSPYEVIGRCTFLPWQQALRLRCMVTTFAVGRLIDWLTENKRISLTVK